MRDTRIVCRCLNVSIAETPLVVIGSHFQITINASGLAE